MRGRVFPLLALVFALMVAAPAARAQETSEGPVLREANVRVVQDRDGVEVTERLVVAGGAQSIEHVLARFGGADVEGLSVRAGGRELDVGRERGGLVDRISVPVSGGANGAFAYEVSYRYPGEAGSGKVPLVVPAAPTAGDDAVVTVDLVLPEGRYLRDSFPVIEPVESGNPGASMTSFPSFVSYEVGSSPGGLLTASNAYTALALMFIIGCVLGLLLYDRRSGRREVAHA